MKILAIIVTIPFEGSDLHGVYDEEHREEAEILKAELHKPDTEWAGDHAEIVELELNQRRWPPE